MSSVQCSSHYSDVVQMGVVYQAFGSGEGFSQGGTVAAQSSVSATRAGCSTQYCRFSILWHGHSLRGSLRARGFSRKAAKLISRAMRKSTSAVYEGHFREFSR